MPQKRRYHAPEAMIENEADSGTAIVTNRAVKLPKLDPDERSQPADEGLGEKNELKELVDRVKCEPPSEPSYTNLEDDKFTIEEINVKCELEKLNYTVQKKRELSLQASYINVKEEKITIEESDVKSEVFHTKFDSTKSQPVGIEDTDLVKKSINQVINTDSTSTSHSNSAPKRKFSTCFVPMCPSNSTIYPNKIFLNGPLHPELRKRWFQAARREQDDLAPKSAYKCCEDHFDLENDVENWVKYKLVGGRLFLKKNVVPHFFECQNIMKPLKRTPSILKTKKLEVVESIKKDYATYDATMFTDPTIECFPETEIPEDIEKVNENKMPQKRGYHPPEEMINNEADSGTAIVTNRAVKLPKLVPDGRSEPADEGLGEKNELKELVDRVKCEPPSEPSYINLEDDKFTIEEMNVKCEFSESSGSIEWTIESSPRSVDDDASASTSATTCAKPPTIAGPKSNAQRQREYRQRIAASRTPAQSIAARKSDIERHRNYRLRKASLALASGSLESTTASSSCSAGRSNDVQNGTQRQLTNQQCQSLAVEPAQTTLQPGTSSDQIEVSDEPMDLPDLPLPSKSNAPIETQDAAALTSAMQFAKPPTVAAPKSSAQRKREYRQRIAASRNPAQSIATRKSETERKRNYRIRKAANLALTSGSIESTTASSSRSAGRSNDVQNGTQRQLTNQQSQSLAVEPPQTTVQPGTSSYQIKVQQAQSTWNTKWNYSTMRFTSIFLDNDFGYTCSVCDRLWFKNDLKPITAAQLKVISDWFIKKNLQLCREEYELVCNTCKRPLNNKSMPPLAKVNGFSYPDRPPGLPPLDPISERLISPRLPFMQVRRLRHDVSDGIIGQVINVPVDVPVDVQDMVKCLPRQLNEDDVINVNIKRNLAQKSDYISGYMSKSTIKAWLDVLQKSPLYRLYEINMDLLRLNPTVPLLDDIQNDPSNCIENISAENTPESEILASRQHTMIWNEEDCLRIAPGHQAKPLNNIIYDRHAEELSFPSIYFGEPRLFNVPVTHYMMATSEIRRRDRRGATPQKILYVAMKILRLRMVNEIHNTFRNSSVTKNVTRLMLENTEFLKEHIQNVAFKTVPNSVQYWASRKRDLFAMIRQLGKPTVFLSISANEIQWMKLLTILLKLSNKYPGKTAKDLNTSQRCTLVSDDPVTCCIYFYRLVGSLMKLLKSKQLYNPFGNYSVKDYFIRIEFQHCGSPHAHILLWLNDDPHETLSENMPKTIELVEKLSSVAQDDVPNDSIYATQIHKHTFTCTKRGETTCRFGIPYWPMSTTRVLVPMPQSDRRRQTLQQIANELRTSLGERRYACMDDFLEANNLTYASYLDIVRSTLRRPTLLFRRNFDELMTNTFNPYIAGEVNSNIDIQFILDEYCCAEYVVEYLNKSARGMSNLRRELTTMMQEHPEQDYNVLLKALSNKLLNAVEMSAQEAAWYLLRQPLSETSRDIVYIPTVWPTERQRRRNRRLQMDREGIDGDSTNVWTKNIIQIYEERPASLEQVYLAEFAAWYAKTSDFVDEADDVHMDDDEDSEGVPKARTLRAPKEYRRRLTGRIIRHRRYDIDETDNYKREMVLLYVQFRNEMSEIVDQNKFLQLFDDNKDTIMERRSLFETNSNIENVMKELEALMILQNEDNSNLQEEESRTTLGEDV